MIEIKVSDFDNLTKKCNSHKTLNQELNLSGMKYIKKYVYLSIKYNETILYYEYCTIIFRVQVGSKGNN